MFNFSVEQGRIRTEAVPRTSAVRLQEPQPVLGTGVTCCTLLLVAMPGAPSSVLVSSDGLHLIASPPSKFTGLIVPWPFSHEPLEIVRN